MIRKILVAASVFRFELIVVTMVDHTSYPAGLEPALALRQVFGRLNTSSELCLKASKAGLRSVESFAMLGDDLKSAKTTLKTITASAPLGGNESEIEVALLALAAVWQTCHTYQAQMDQLCLVDHSPHRLMIEWRVILLKSI